MRSIKAVDDAYIDRHFGTERAQYQRAKAFAVLKAGNIGLSTIKVKNVQSKERPGKHLVAFTFQCLSSHRSVVHNVYVVFENNSEGEYVPSPLTYCGCENGAFFCSHMLVFLYLVRCVQRNDLSQDEMLKILPEYKKIALNRPCLIEFTLMHDKLKRERAQVMRQNKKPKA